LKSNTNLKSESFEAYCFPRLTARYSQNCPKRTKPHSNGFSRPTHRPGVGPNFMIGDNRRWDYWINGKAWAPVVNVDEILYGHCHATCSPTRSAYFHRGLLSAFGGLLILTFGKCKQIRDHKSGLLRILLHRISVQTSNSHPQNPTLLLADNKKKKPAEPPEYMKELR